jgi:two-component system LytT family response regulator
MRIAICDDDEHSIDSLIAIIKEHPLTSDEISTFDSAVALLEAYNRGVRFDLLLLDIQMEKINGFKAAEHLFQHYRDELPRIVFVTVTNKYVFAGYDVRAFGYLSKPIDKARLLKKLDQAYDELSGGSISVRVDGENVMVPIKDILFVETENNKVIINTTSRKYPVRLTIGEISAMLPKPTFMQSHRCYIVNLAHVRRYDEKYIYFDDSRVADISRSKKKEFLLALHEYLKR